MQKSGSKRKLAAAFISRGLNFGFVIAIFPQLSRNRLQPKYQLFLHIFCYPLVYKSPIEMEHPVEIWAAELGIHNVDISGFICLSDFT